MAGREISAASADITVDGTAAGYITVADNTPFYVGAKAFVSDGTDSYPVTIVEIAASGVIGLRNRTVRSAPSLESPNYGRSSCVTYTAAGGWALYQEAQLVWVASQG